MMNRTKNTSSTYSSLRSERNHRMWELKVKEALPSIDLTTPANRAALERSFLAGLTVRDTVEVVTHLNA